MALLGAPAGNMNANDETVVTGSINLRGLMDIDSAYGNTSLPVDQCLSLSELTKCLTIGRNIVLAAALLVTSVKNMLIVDTITESVSGDKCCK